MKVRMANLDDLPAVNALCREQLGQTHLVFAEERGEHKFRFSNARMITLLFSKREFTLEVSNAKTLFCVVESNLGQLLGYLIVSAHHRDLNNTYMYRDQVSNTYFHVERFYVARHCSSCVGKSLFRKFESWRDSLLKLNWSVTKVISIQQA